MSKVYLRDARGPPARSSPAGRRTVGDRTMHLFHISLVNRGSGPLGEQEMNHVGGKGEKRGEQGSQQDGGGKGAGHSAIPPRLTQPPPVCQAISGALKMQVWVLHSLHLPGTQTSRREKTCEQLSVGSETDVSVIDKCDHRGWWTLSGLGPSGEKPARTPTGRGV